MGLEPRHRRGRLTGSLVQPLVLICDEDMDHKAEERGGNDQLEASWLTGGRRDLPQGGQVSAPLLQGQEATGEQVRA